MQADYGFAVTNLAYLLAPALNVVGNGLFYAFGILSVGTAVGWWLAGQTLETVLLAWYVQRRLAGFGRPDLALARRALAFGARAHPGRIMLLGNYRLDQWLLGRDRRLARARGVQRRRRLGRGSLVPADGAFLRPEAGSRPSRTGRGGAAGRRASSAPSSSSRRSSAS